MTALVEVRDLSVTYPGDRRAVEVPCHRTTERAGGDVGCEDVREGLSRDDTDAQIAGQLYITVRTVSSHLDRVRDKTGCRRRADLTRLALSAGLV